MHKVENTELKEYYEKFDELPFLPMMASYEDDIYQYLLSMALLRGTPLTEEEINKEYENKVDIVGAEIIDPNDFEKHEEYVNIMYKLLDYIVKEE